MATQVCVIVDHHCSMQTVHHRPSGKRGHAEAHTYAFCVVFVPSNNETHLNTSKFDKVDSRYETDNQAYSSRCVRVKDIT